jgi:hypothetical protein
MGKLMEIYILLKHKAASTEIVTVEACAEDCRTWVPEDYTSKNIYGDLYEIQIWELGGRNLSAGIVHSKDF